MSPSRVMASEECFINKRDSSRAESEPHREAEGFGVPLSQTRASSEEQDISASGELSEQDYESQSNSLQGGDLEDQAASTKPIQFVINVPEVNNASEYEEIIENNTVDSVLEELKDPGNETWYKVLFEDGREDQIPSSQLTTLPNGTNALDLFIADAEDESTSDSEPLVRNRQTRSMSFNIGKRARPARPTTRNSPNESEDELSMIQPAPKKRLLTRGPRMVISGASDQPRRSGRNSSTLISDETDEGSEPKFAKSTRVSTRGKSKVSYNYDLGLDRLEQDEEMGSDQDFVQVGSDIRFIKSKVTKKGTKKVPDRRSRRQIDGGTTKAKAKKEGSFELSSEDERPEPSRRSGRTTKAAKNMREVVEEDEVFAEEDELLTEDKANSRVPNVMNIREVFKALSPRSPFRLLHNKTCDACKSSGLAESKGPLVHCQGCTTSIHKICLGPRSAREHIVTKIADSDFVLQCRRCTGLAKKKDSTAPRLDICQSCKVPGASCREFSTKRTARQEEKLRTENDGVDPITDIAATLVNNPDNVLFRCVKCRRAFHFEHLPTLGDDSTEAAVDQNARAERIGEYIDEFRCKDCRELPGDVKGIVAWRPLNIDTYVPQTPLNDLAPEEKEYLIRWADRSYFQCTWMPGAWVWGSVAKATKAAFARQEENQLPKMTEEDAIPEEYLRMEIVLDVRYTSNVSAHGEKIDRARINEVDEVLVKFQGLGYNEVVWEHPPDPSESERWADFVTAYNEFLAGKYFKQPPANMQKRIDDYRRLNFAKFVKLDEQPSALTGGKLMNYQMEGLNWLLYNYHKRKSVILADEMGLGKTLQIISLIVTLVKDKPKTWPFLVVVPNSTCPNWRREIQTWAPSLRVVAYYGDRDAREMAMKYELFPNGAKDLRAHIVVTSYEAPVDDHSRQFFRRIKWSGVIVDEGQRLKNDKNLLYSALQAINTPFKVLVTGTPLQNNKRELFNLLQFIDDSIDAEALDEEFSELNNENIPKLHGMIKPYFLRRTKATTLKFLPPLSQVIVPVTMSVVQKQLYKSILSRNPELMRSIFASTKTASKPGERGNLNNILVQLRKVLCHPFMFSQAVEERELTKSALHRNLVEASSKLQLLDIMLPKLRERGHRVLIFSQFLAQLDIIEDFLVGLGFQFERLDGSVGTLEKQRRIDAFNAPDSPLFAFLLSTRAGGVGINLATADTVIIMDPDFNPHQDIQALSRAHRIGQKKKVLVFQLMTKDSAEEKIVQIGRKKMALDHVLIESLDQEDDADLDLESILKHGATALFEDNEENDIRYNSSSVDKLLDRTIMENTNAGDDKTVESAFSFARVWANDQEALTDDIGDADSPGPAESFGVWDKLLEERAAEAAREAEVKKEILGKGKRVRKVSTRPLVFNLVLLLLIYEGRQLQRSRRSCG